MDRNSIYGIIAIFVIFIGYFWLTKPSEKEIAAQKRRHDSISRVQQIAQEKKIKENIKQITGKITDSIQNTSSGKVNVKNDSVKKIIEKNKFGSFFNASEGKQKFITIENENIKVKISNKGGKIVSVQLKKYKTFDGKPLILFDEKTSKFGFTFFADNRDISTDELFFQPVVVRASSVASDSLVVNKSDSVILSMRLYPASKDSLSKKDKYVEFVYTLKENSFVLGYKVNFKGMKDIMTSNADFVNLSWNVDLNRKEKNAENEKHNSTIYYKYLQDDVDYLSETKDDKKALSNKVKWVSFKDQFFSSVLIANSSFNNAEIKTTTEPNSVNHVKKMSAEISVPYVSADQYSIPMSFYFGPNKYKILRKFNLDLERQIPLGWSFFLMQWINRFAVLPVFNFLEGFNINYGIIILILTVLLKIVLTPISYKTYISSAKMKILKPEIDEISAKFPKKDDALKKQQATMALYKKAGVSPLSGCVPMLLQFPILIAMFRFFPAAIELRQQSFLWATDLSSYDSIYNLPFNIPYYGDHISLFTLLMTISTVLYTMVNNQMMASSTQQMPGMKTMMYIMPVMFLGIFNNYSAGLSYYYFLANIFTFVQIYGMKRFVN